MDPAEEEKDWEDWCFVCKDGGDLLLCDYKDCPKAYHASCVGDDNTSAKENEDSFICKWHSCYLCGKSPKLHCLACPHAVCEDCVTHAEFINLKEKKGLCNQCQEYVFFVEEIQMYDAAGDKIDLTDRNTFECLFLECWEITKKQEGITFDHVIDAKKSQKKVAKLRPKVDPRSSLHDAYTSKKGVDKLKHKADPKCTLSDNVVEIDAEDYKKKKMEYIRWGSKPLIDFLTFMGEDTRKAMSQHRVESVIHRYIRRKNLLDPKKKKKVRCDEKLYSIFKKKSVKQRKIYTLLKAHFRENLEEVKYVARSERGCFSGNNGKVLVPPRKKQKIDERTCEKEVEPELLSTETCVEEVKPEMQSTETCEEEVKPEMRPTGLATISADNIKLVYLRKSLVLELSKQSESFNEKVVGSFVKVKNGPRDRLAFQILEVTGTKTADDESQSVFLYVAGMESDVSISRLDDSDISKEEIEDLKQKVTSGLLRQPTVVEMEQKATALHEDITKHWIARQLVILQRRIICANEKGWRKEYPLKFYHL
ncbi:unnamed protein product [Microthlaspi erraticum]|uniref:Uncharacterized protein n=1 Tax=Microthlaspi erraticum TaxID=1685480 RepID=A0A6D2JQX5_9BRAS|nr:unnamed protein product [Microthlaspi erraticum]